MNVAKFSKKLFPLAVKTNSSRFDDKSKRKYGRLTVLTCLGKDLKNNTWWKCACRCGNYSIVKQGQLSYGATLSCGCIRAESSRAALKLAQKAKKIYFDKIGRVGKTPEYAVFRGMIQRCKNPKCPNWLDYGGKGIKVCKRWKNFNAFIGDMGKRPSPKHSIDRKNNNGNYTPKNCRWATRAEQESNKRTSRFFTFNGETMIVARWAKRFKINRGTIGSRIRSGWHGSSVLKPARPRLNPSPSVP